MMIKFKENKNPNLAIDGYTVIENKIFSRIFSKFTHDKEYSLSEIANKSKGEDVFRTKLGDIKQIQNLNSNENYSSLVDTINCQIAKTLGFTDYEVLNNQLFCKPPNYKMTSAHQDNIYFESDSDIYTVWIPLQDVDTLNSCMFYVPGSHLKGLVEHKAIGTNTRVRTGVKGVSMYSSFYKNKEFNKVSMKKFDLLVHDKNTMHFSSPNLSDNYRIAFTAIIKVNKIKDICDHAENSKSTTLKDSSHWEKHIVSVKNGMTGEMEEDDRGVTVYQNTCVVCGEEFKK
jgi:ectoine hydroxylase-related dioxygenase (phytanoyl-CoA dioxygenase family)